MSGVHTLILVEGTDDAVVTASVLRSLGFQELIDSDEWGRFQRLDGQLSVTRLQAYEDSRKGKPTVWRQGEDTVCILPYAREGPVGEVLSANLRGLGVQRIDRVLVTGDSNGDSDARLRKWEASIQEHLGDVLEKPIALTMDELVGTAPFEIGVHAFRAFGADQGTIEDLVLGGMATAASSLQEAAVGFIDECASEWTSGWRRSRRKKAIISVAGSLCGDPSANNAQKTADCGWVEEGANEADELSLYRELLKAWIVDT